MGTDSVLYAKEPLKDNLCVYVYMYQWSIHLLTYKDDDDWITYWLLF